MPEPWQKGDRVRVTYEGEVASTYNGLFEVTIRDDNGRLIPFIIGATGKVTRLDP